MIVFLNDGQSDFIHYRDAFSASGEDVAVFLAHEFLDMAKHGRMLCDNTVEAVVIESAQKAQRIVEEIVTTVDVPVLVLTENRVAEQTIGLLRSGADDVVCKPIHNEELALRVAALKRRHVKQSSASSSNRIMVHFDGREPEYNGNRLELRRRERRILEYLVFISGRRATKSQIFEAVYGINAELYDERVVESHICRLRKRLKELLGHDPISSVRHLGYQIDANCVGAGREPKFTAAA